MLAKLIHSSLSSSSSSGRVATRLNVEEEYKQTLRTKSYIEIWNKAHHKLKRTTTISNEEEDMMMVLEENPNCMINSSSAFSLPDLLLEPKQEVVIHLRDHDQGGFSSASLGDYFDATFQAFTACSSLLNSIERTRYHHKTILQILNKSKKNNNISELTSMLDLPNPIDLQTLSYLHEMRKALGSLTERLTEARRRMKRRMRVVNAWKRVSVVLLVAACSAAAAAALVVAGHVVVVFGVVAVVPVVVGKWRGRRRRRRVEKVVEGVDAAARGAYIVGREMETMGRMVRRVGDEVEHRREVARMAARSGERRMVREAVREMESGEEGFARQVKELEEHVYLSLLTINRTRS